MSFTKGKISFTACPISMGKAPIDILRLAREKSALPIELAMKTEDSGFASGSVLRDNEITEVNSMLGLEIVRLNYRETFKRIDNALMKANLQELEELYKKDHRTDRIPRIEHKRMREELKAFMEKTAATSIRGTEFVITPEMLLIESTSEKMVDRILTVSALNLGIEVNRKDVTAEEGRLFLTWLFKKQLESGTVTDDADHVFLISGPLEFSAKDTSANVVRAKLEGVKVGIADEAVELLKTHLIRKAKIRISVSSCTAHYWDFTFDADKWCFSAVDLPENVRKEPCDRIAALQSLFKIFSVLFDRFVKESEVENA